jgi:hypothetical protein
MKKVNKENPVKQITTNIPKVCEPGLAERYININGPI